MARSNLLLACAAVSLVIACGGGTPAPDAPKTDAPTDAAKADAPKGDTKADAAKGDASKDAKGDAAKADAPKDAPKDPAKSDRLEDVKMAKTTSAGGSYAVNVVSAAGIAPDDVVRALANKADDCFAAMFKKQMGVVGKTSFDVTFTGKGKTATVKVRSDDLKNPDLAKCLDKVVKAIAWPNVTDPKAGGKSTFEFAVVGG